MLGAFLLIVISMSLLISATTSTWTAYGSDGVAAALTEWTIPTASSLPTGLALDSSGNCCWFVESAGSKVAHFDPSTDTFREWTIPTPSSNPTGLALTTISGSLAVFGTEFAKNRVFIFFPGTGTFKEYELPTPDSGPQQISIELGGTEIRAWFTELGAPSNRYKRNSIGEMIYNPASGTARLYELTLPSAAGGGAIGVHASPGIIYFGGINAIVRWDRATSEFTTWAIPSHVSTQGAFVDIDPSGQVWYTSRSSSGNNYVGTLRSNNTFTEWQVPTVGADAAVISVNPITQDPWIAEYGGDKIAKLDPSGDGVSTGSRPAIARSDPLAGAILTHVASPVLPSTVAVDPAVSIPSVSTTEQFTEWTLAAGSRPHDVVVSASGDVWILESSANKIARLSLTPDFIIECDPTFLITVQGANGTSTCTATSVGGFGSAVQLAGSWVGTEPAGVAYTLPSPITPPPGGTISSTLIISAGDRASTGTFTFHIAATAVSLVHSVNVTVTIVAGVADFTISLSPSYVSVSPGQSATSTIAVQSLGVFFSPIDLTASGAPSGITFVFDTNPVTPPVRETVWSTLTVRVSGPTEGPTPEGIYRVTIRGTSGLLARNATLTVQVTRGACLIATTTYGSELSDEVQFLRNFRDNSILKTNAGSNFMIAFNAWYYSFSPSIAQFIREHPAARTTTKIALYPLIGILRIGAAAFNLFPTNSEAGAVLSGLVVSSLIGVTYLAIPFTVLLAYSRRARWIAKRSKTSLVVVLLSALGAVAFMTTFGGPTALMMVATPTVVLASLAASTLLASGAIVHITRFLRPRDARRQYQSY